MNWAALLLGLAQALALVLTWARERELMEAGKSELIAALLREQSDAIRKANAARAAADTANADPASLRSDDGHRRPD